MKIHYRKMKKEDIHQVFLIDQACFSHNWAIDSYQKEMDNFLATYIVALDQEKIVGFGGYWLIIDEAHITNIAVIDAYRKKGIGQAIFNKMVELAASQASYKMTLEVREDNFAAISFYEKNGFIKEGLRAHYYGDNRHALIMWRYSFED